jgi:D-tyrosyl-tRNA(Tyr) deacylase
MICVIQRVKSAEVSVEGKTVGKCDNGLLILICAVKGDTEEIATKMAAKILKMRIFEDQNGKMNLSPVDVGATALAVSNFTLAASCRRGTRPDFFAAEGPVLANELYEKTVDALRQGGLITETGVFGADMQITPVLDGPVTIILDSEKDLSHTS